MFILSNIITLIITSSLVAGIVSAIVTGLIDKHRYIFERKFEAYSIIINQILLLLNKIPCPVELNEYIQISENNYYDFKIETDKYILFLNKKQLLLFNEISKLFLRNVYIDQYCGSDPNNHDYLLFDEDERSEIILLKDKLLICFQTDLGITKLNFIRSKI